MPLAQLQGSLLNIQVRLEIHLISTGGIEMEKDLSRDIGNLFFEAPKLRTY